MKLVTLFVVTLLFSPVSWAQTCPLSSCPSDSHNAWCRTATSVDWVDGNGRFCDMCSPNAGICLYPNGDVCVNDCRACTDGAGTHWTQDPIYNCVTASTPYAQLCQLCKPGILQAVSCDPFYCGAIDAVHCRARDCFTCP